MRRRRLLMLAVGSLSALALAVAPGIVRGQSPTADAERQAAIDALYEGYRPAFATAPEITVEAYRTLAAERPTVLLDVRTAKERAVSMIEGAIDEQTFTADPERYRDHVVVPYCTIGYRSGEATVALQEKGFDARNLRGGILSWTHAQGALVIDGAPTTRLHVYGKRWNLAASGYQTTW